MTALPQHKMTVDEYLVWAEGRPGRFSLHEGNVYAEAPQRAVHARVKLAIHVALIGAVRTRGLPCHVMPDGMTVRISDATAYEPDALVYCGAEVPPSALEVPNPMIVVEVLSPSSQRIDALIKLPGYFRVPSIIHYLIVDPDQPLVIHHARGSEDTIITRIFHAGTIPLAPPGIELSLV